MEGKIEETDLDWTVGTCGVAMEFEDETDMIGSVEIHVGPEIITGHGEETMLDKEEDIFAKGNDFSLDKTYRDI